jgi:hypothetical protein
MGDLEADTLPRLVDATLIRSYKVLYPAGSTPNLDFGGKVRIH